MTEEDWLACSSPGFMVDALQDLGCVSQRKFRLFLCACCRDTGNFRHRFGDLRIRRAVDVAERFADGHLTDEERAAAHRVVAELAGELRNVLSGLEDVGEAYWEAAYRANSAEAAAYAVLGSEPLFRPEPAGDIGTLFRAAIKAVMAHEYYDDDDCPVVASLLREVVGNPYSRVALAPEWLTPTVLALSRGIYAERAFDRLPILADALQDAGCEDEQLLGHCRATGPHVRGCWALDLVLGKD